MSLNELIKDESPLTDRTRLAIMAALVGSRTPIDFTSLVKSLGLTKGNVSSHMRRLEEAGFVKVKKAFVNRKPWTTYGCTAKGRKEVENYLRRIESVLALAMEKET